MKEYLLQQNYLEKDKGWQRKEEILEGYTYEEAAQVASDAAHMLDEEYGDSHFWTVNLMNPEGSSYFELFHGRLS